MLPLVLVLLVAQSALSVPVIQVTGRSINEIGASNSLTDAAFDVLDNGASSFYVLTAQKIINDIFNSNDNYYKATAAGQALNLLGEYSVGTSGDACAYADYVNAAAADNGRAALGVYVNRLLQNIDNIVNLAVNPNGAKYTRGPAGGCSGGGRSYNFEAAWGQVVGDADTDTLTLIDEQYCAAKRLANSLHSRDVNVGAGITAASIGPAVQIIELALGPVTNLLGAIASGGDPSGAAAQAKGAIQNAASRL